MLTSLKSIDPLWFLRASNSPVGFPGTEFAVVARPGPPVDVTLLSCQLGVFLPPCPLVPLISQHRGVLSLQLKGGFQSIKSENLVVNRADKSRWNRIDRRSWYNEGNSWAFTLVKVVILPEPVMLGALKSRVSLTVRWWLYCMHSPDT